MCGIAGVAGDRRAAELVRGMMEVQRHRGPDGEGVFIDSSGEVALGHRRLAILDLTSAGAQPMTSGDGRWTIVLNGELFNYVELRQELGGPFHSGTDTEVLLRACAEWGVEKALARSIGMFAFALWDARERELTLARDRVGEKPLVYFQHAGMLAFASELKALAPFHDRRLDPQAMDAYLALGYVPAPLAVFRGCRKLEPGHLLRFKDGRAEARRWWRPEQAAAGREQTRPQRVEHLRSIVADAVRLRLRADVPVAIFLSGGVDSSVIAAECARQGSRIEAFTADFGGGHPDGKYAVRVAEHLGLRHEILRIEANQAAAGFEQLLWHYDEPFADSSSIPSFALARALQGRYKVVMNGEGGDEAFGGYRHYEHIAAKQALKAAAAAAGLTDGATNVYVESKTSFRAGERTRLLNGSASGNSLSWLLRRDGYLAPPGGGALKRALWSDRHLYLPNNLAYKVDIALAGNGIEGRGPFLDHRLLEWTQSLPEKELVSGREKKVLLRAAYAADLPPEVLCRPKQGFGAPIEKWLDGPLREWARDMTPSPLLERAPQQNLRGQKLWTLAAFAGWAREWKATW